MNWHLILAAVQLIASAWILGLMIYVINELRRLRRWIEWTRGWIGRANERLKELEDWTQK